METQLAFIIGLFVVAWILGKWLSKVIPTPKVKTFLTPPKPRPKAPPNSNKRNKVTRRNACARCGSMTDMIPEGDREWSLCFKCIDENLKGKYNENNQH